MTAAVLAGPSAGAQRLILASASPTRAAILRNAGLEVTTRPAAVDEQEMKAALRGEGADAAQAAETLAEMKATHVARAHPDALVIGADQMLSCNDVWFDKPPDLAHAAAQLRALSGKPHTLWTAVCVVRGNERLWHHNTSARLTMRTLSDTFIEQYLAACGEEVCHSVGAYQLESVGAQLFSKVEGDFFTILGLPLLPLLDFLRENRVLPK